MLRDTEGNIINNHESSYKSMKDDVRNSPTAPTSTNKKLKTFNPTTEEVLEEYTIIGKEQLNDIVKKSKNALLEWKKDIDKRADFLYAFAKEFRKN
ncbi:MAG TPA: aldehyde dehydrogenase family protein, partial [Nitrososphaeraceae archaeon]|nr:aldehyde dehydrogenase family protein [Nitrososphaeraceae archaeon]